MAAPTQYPTPSSNLLPPHVSVQALAATTQSPAPSPAPLPAPVPAPAPGTARVPMHAPNAASTTMPTPNTPPLPLPAALSRSLEQWARYPRNLVPSTTGISPSALETYRAKLETVKFDLFVGSEKDVEVCFRDLGTNTVKKRNVHDGKGLDNWLGVTKKPHPTDPQRDIITASKEDPKSRFIYMHGVDSRARLRIQKPMLALLFSYHQVMPDYLDFLASFGFQSTARDVRHSAFRRQMSLKQPAVALTGNVLGRSGHQYQIAYNLKGVTQKGEEVWSIRNAAFYHQYDVGTNRALWIVTKGGTDIYESYKELTGSDGRPEDKTFTSAEDCFAASLSPHLLFCRWSTEDWRGYIRLLEEKVDKESKMAVIGLREHGHHAKRYRPSDIQLMQALEEKASEAAVVLEGNVDIMTSLRQLYEGLSKDDRFPCRNSCAGELTDFVNQLDAMISDLKNNSGRARALVKTTADRKELIIQYRGEESADRMHRLNKNMEEETIVVRIITLVTLIYLPATFVSTFFSTDIIKYQDDQYPNGKFSNTAMYRWLQVTLPLTFLTLLAAWVGKMYASKKADEAIDDGGIEVPPLAERLQVGYWLEWVKSRGKWPVRQSPAMPLLPLSKRTTQAQPVNGVAGQQPP